MNDGGEIVGMVDVLKLTYATLEQINTMSSGDGEGPAWNKFWLSIDNETESLMSGEGSHSHQHTTLSSRILSPDATQDRLGDSVAPGDSASHVGAEPPARSVVLEAPDPVNPADTPFPFKFKAPSGRVHRLQIVASQGFEAFAAAVATKLGNEVAAIGGFPSAEDGKASGPGFALSYMDDEGDTVSITTDNDLVEAIVLARQRRRDKVDLYVHDPDKPPIAPVETPAILTPPPSSVLRERRKGSDDDDGDEDEDALMVRRSRRTRIARPPGQLVAGVPDELLLPGAIVTLVVVIVGVFTIARVTSR